MSIGAIKEKLQNSTVGQLYNLRDEKSRGRVLILSHGVLDFIISGFATGIFYTSFLTINGINIVNAGILTFVPYIAQLVTVFSPSILERLPKRRWFLAACRFVYFLLYILGVTVMPEFVTDPQLRLSCFVGLVLLANVINSLGGQGYTVWHAQFLPEEHRSNYFSFNSLVMNFVASLISVLSASAADAMVGTPNENAIIIGIRYFAFVLGVADVILLLLLKEYPYPKSEKKQQLSDVFILSMKNKKFFRTTVVCFVYSLVQNLPAGVLTYYLLNTVRISYSLTYLINIAYPVFLALLFPYWCRKLEKLGWVRVFNLGNLLDIPAIIAIALLNESNVVWLYTALRFFQHYLGVGRNTAHTNFLYMNMPAEAQTNYATFYALAINLAAVLGIAIGTWFVSAVGDRTLVLLGHSFGAVPMLVLLQAAASGLMALFVLFMEPLIRPEA